MRYVYQLIGIQCFAETRFEDAGKALFNGDFDPRVIVSYFPDVVGRMFGDKDEMNMFRGVKERMPSEGSVDDLSESLSSCPLLHIQSRLSIYTFHLYILHWITTPCTPSHSPSLTSPNSTDSSHQKPSQELLPAPHTFLPAYHGTVQDPQAKLFGYAGDVSEEMENQEGY